MSIEEIIRRQSLLEKSDLYKVFTPNQPSTDNFFCGRERETSNILEALHAKKCHVLLYGDRGVGKTSLATYSCSKANEYYSLEFHRVACDRHSTFGTIMAQFLTMLDVDIVAKKTSSVKKSGGLRTNLSLSKEKQFTTESPLLPTTDDVNWVVQRLRECNECVLLIDEFDLIASEEKKYFSTLMKHLSDNKSPVLLMIVGVSLTMKDLMAGHASTIRSITEVNLNRMSSQELSDIITKGEERIGIQFLPAVKERIVQDSMGFPYFTHLLALESAKNTIGEGRGTVTLDDYREGVATAIKENSSALQSKIDATLGFRNTELRKKLLLAAASIDDKVFTAEQWRNKYHEITGSDITQNKINANMDKAIQDSPDSVLQREAKGRYFFADPRMPVYIKLCCSDILECRP